MLRYPALPDHVRRALSSIFKSDDPAGFSEESVNDE